MKSSSSLSKKCRVPGCIKCKPNKSHYCKNCGNTDSTHFSKDCPIKINKSFDHTIKNAVLLYIDNRNNIILIRDKHNNKWMLPGGKIDPGETPVVAAFREFYEETTILLNRNMYNTNDYYDRSHVNNTKTRIFIIRGSVIPIPSVINTNETNGIKYVSLNNLIQSVTTYNSLNLKDSNVNSLKEMIKCGKI